VCSSDLIPQEIIATCGATFLLDEIKELKPSAIFVLGNSAKKALQNLPPFSDLASHKVTEDYDKVLCGIRVILCVYPGGKTRGHMDSIKKAFSKIS
jgi:uracil-DNA glycosylase